MTPEALSALRREYAAGGLRRRDLAPEPLDQFAAWLAEAQARQVPEPNAMTLSTVDANHQPWSRTVLLKAVDQRGFTFFSNYESAKAEQLALDSRAALTFWWAALERQVNVTGTVARTSREESESYFGTRPRPSQLGAWASRQSAMVTGRGELETQLAAVAERYPGEVPTPPHWGGYTLSPSTVEFWQGRTSRLHDRLRYRRSGGAWVIERLSP